jgi:aryl-alcohol dehydrogenase-like predicted oxidoreductase
MSSIGAGTYLGEPDDAIDREYIAAIATALGSGINVLDTAINYRHQRSERCVGAALRQRVDSGDVKRNEVMVCTKAGYLSFDGELPVNPRAYFMREYVEPGIIDPAQLAGGMHCMSPAYLENQVERSRRNLDLETIDVFYIHNPESQLAEITREAFQHRLRDAFVMLERLVKAGSIAYYGIATWSAFRLAEGARDYVGLAEVEALAREAGGARHHFRFVQLPFSLAMPEAFALANQRVEKQKMPLLMAAAELGIAVVGSATLHQGQLRHGMPEPVRQVLGLKSDAENAIQFARSAPGITTALVGMSHREHVAANVRVGLVAPTPRDEWTGLFTKT